MAEEQDDSATVTDSNPGTLATTGSVCVRAADLQAHVSHFAMPRMEAPPACAAR